VACILAGVTGRHGSVHVRPRRSFALAQAAVAALLCAPAGALAGKAQTSRAQASATPWWSPARDLASGCAIAGEPQIAFPSEAPSRPTGPGAIVWSADPSRCSAGPGAAADRPPSIALAPLGARDRPGAARSLTLVPGALSGRLEAEGLGGGQIAVLAALRTSARARATATLLQARHGRALELAELAAGAPPLSLARAYLGDGAIVAVRAGAIAVCVERHYQSRFGPARLIPLARGEVTALTAAMDYRSDVLVAWQQNGSIFAHMLRASGRAERTQRVGPGAPYAQLHALVSDNDHGMIAWASTDERAGGAHTRIFLALSSAGVTFAHARELAAFGDVQRVGRLPGSIELERLSTENVLLAWTDLESGHYVVRAAPAVLALARPATRLSDPRRQTVLADLAPGPAGEALALWKSSPRAARSSRAPLTQLWVARASIMRHDRLAMRAAELIGVPGAGTLATIAVDPADDRALAAWFDPGRDARIQYAASRGRAGYAPPGPASRALAAAPAAAAAGGPGAALLAAAALIVAASVLLALRHRALRRARTRR
jgi:hypothetical protein